MLKRQFIKDGIVKVVLNRYSLFHCGDSDLLLLLENPGSQYIDSSFVDTVICDMTMFISLLRVIWNNVHTRMYMDAVVNLERGIAEFPHN